MKDVLEFPIHAVCLVFPCQKKVSGKVNRMKTKKKGKEKEKYLNEQYMPLYPNPERYNFKQLCLVFYFLSYFPFFPHSPFYLILSPPATPSPFGPLYSAKYIPLHP